MDLRSKVERISDMFRYIFYGIIALSICSAESYALDVQNADIKQKNVGNVEAKLEANNILNSIVQNSASGNTFVGSGDATIQGAQITQENFGNISSELSVNNIANQTIQQNVAGTVVVIN
jgi:hypothetical protein